MSATHEPNPPSRREEDFPKTNTMPEGWSMDELMEMYNSPRMSRGSDTCAPTPAHNLASVPATGASGNHSGTNNKVHHADEEVRSSEELFTRRLDPFPTPGEEHGMWL